MYKLLRDLLFCLPAEISHTLSLRSIDVLARLRMQSLVDAPPQGTGKPRTVMGIEFPNPVGLAAGLDKSADHFDALASLGFGFVEVGTVTPRPQPGNPKPRLFRLVKEKAIINRMGFNNLGIEHAVSCLARRRTNAVVGVNIGKNFDTPVEQALSDYLVCLDRAFDHADYLVVNISSPNTPGLRTLQFGKELDNLLQPLRARCTELCVERDREVPLVLKIAPDLSEQELDDICQSISNHRIDGVIATNTTLQRDAVEGSKYRAEAGGLSGAPLTQRSNAVIASLRKNLGDSVALIGVGGIMTADDALRRFDSGADLVQLYSGFIYEGPALIRAILAQMAASD